MDNGDHRLHLIPKQFTVKAQEPLIPTWLYKMIASMEAAIFNCQCDQILNCEGGCETIMPEQFTVKAREPLMPTWLYKMVASMEAAIFNCQCDQMQKTAKAVVKPFIVLT